MKRVWAALFILVCSAGSVMASVQTVTVRADGLVLNDPSQPLETRLRSLIEAQRSAVERAIGTQVRARSLVDKSILVESSISTRTAGRIRRYRVIRQRVEGIYYRTLIEADVDLSDPGDDRPNLQIQLSTIPAEKIAGVLAWIDGIMPSEDRLKSAQDDPLPVIRAFYHNLKARTTAAIPDRLLFASLAKELGISADRTTLDELESDLSQGEDQKWNPNYSFSR